MFVIYETDRQKHPIKVWLGNKEQVEPGCLEQAINLSNLPFIHKWVALMPDTHQGYGMPIGGVIATEGVIIPNAVGVDIGCGMAFLETNITAKHLKDGMLNNLVGQIMRNIPTGFGHHQFKQGCKALDEFGPEYKIPELLEEIPRGYFQVGTLGGGNHFIEIQEDEVGKVCIMLHSGSRNFGFKVAKYFNTLANELNRRWFSKVPKEHELAFLPVDTEEGRAYIEWMNLALNFAQENRAKMLEAVEVEMERMLPGIGFTIAVNAHHNYASLENHFGKNAWVHRKGAIRARAGEIGIIPGAMGSYSYIVEGLGNPDSFNSCSHGAGRRMGRKEAKRNITVEEAMLDLKIQGVVLGKQKKDDVAEESRFAYKDIDMVINQELDLIKPVKKLRTLAVVKG